MTMPKSKNNPQSNKDKILQVAIDLFAQNGYTSVTLREIAGTVGIKAASIYNHYESKEAILDEIVHYFRMQLHQKVHPAFENTDHADIHTYIESTIKANEAFFIEPLHSKIGLVIMREQFQNEKIRHMLLDELIISPRRMLSAYFEKMMLNGKMRNADPIIAAIEYHAFFIYEFYENSLAQQPVNQIRKQLERSEHVRLFLETWAIRQT